MSHKYLSYGTILLILKFGTSAARLRFQGAAAVEILPFYTRLEPPTETTLQSVYEGLRHGASSHSIKTFYTNCLRKCTLVEFLDYKTHYRLM